MLGLCYADESSAEQMYKKVSNRSKYMKSSSGSSGFSIAKKLTNFMSSSSSDDRKSKSHVSEDTKLEPGLVAQLGNMGVSESDISCLLYTSPSPRDKRQSRMPSSA